MYHDPPAMGHPGVDKMTAAMNKEVYWQGMIRDIKQFVGSCETCQRFKSHNPQIPTEKMPIPTQPFEDVSMDVVGPVPSSSTGYQYVLVIQDRLSRWLIFVPMRNSSAETIARLFLTEWVCQFGVPKRILTDRGSNFLSHTMKELNSSLGVHHVKTAAYHPQGNGQNERTHRQLHSYLSMFLSPTTRRTWDTMLKYASWVHNSSHHEALQASPFEIMTGLRPTQARAWLPGNDPTREALEHTSQYFGVKRNELEAIRHKARDAIAKAQAGYLSRLNIHKKAGKFQVGQKILLRNQDRSTYVSRKWSPKYLGPYVIIQMLSPVTFRAQNLANKQVGIFHAVHAKPYKERVTGKPSVIDQIEQGSVPTFMPLMEDDEMSSQPRRLPIQRVDTEVQITEPDSESVESEPAVETSDVEIAEEAAPTDDESLSHESSASSFRYQDFFNPEEASDRDRSEEVSDVELSEASDNDDDYYFSIGPRRTISPVPPQPVSSTSSGSSSSQQSSQNRSVWRRAATALGFGKKRAQPSISESKSDSQSADSSDSDVSTESDPQPQAVAERSRRSTPAAEDMLFQHTPVRAPPLPTLEETDEDERDARKARERKEMSRARQESLERKRLEKEAAETEKQQRLLEEKQARIARRKLLASTKSKSSTQGRRST
jgi:hypothetical protein